MISSCYMKMRRKAGFWLKNLDVKSKVDPGVNATHE
jgi:hypothetical protein